MSRRPGSIDLNTGAAGQTITTSLNGTPVTTIGDGGVNYHGNQIIGVATPTVADGVVNKGYVDAAISGAGGASITANTSGINSNAVLIAANTSSHTSNKDLIIFRGSKAKKSRLHFLPSKMSILLMIESILIKFPLKFHLNRYLLRIVYSDQFRY